MALATLHMAAIPVLAGLVAGTGAVAAFVSGGQPVQTAAVSIASPEIGRSCETQAWPYIEQKCLAAGTSAIKRTVRFVAAPANMGPAETKPAPSGDLVMRDTVLRAPHYNNNISNNSIAAVPDTVLPEQRLTRKQMRREARQQRAKRRWAAQSYQVPGEAHASRGARPVVVVRPLRLDAFR